MPLFIRHAHAGTSHDAVAAGTSHDVAAGTRHHDADAVVGVPHHDADAGAKPHRAGATDAPLAYFSFSRRLPLFWPSNRRRRPRPLRLLPRHHA